MSTRRPQALLVMNDHAFRSGFDEPRMARLSDLVNLGEPIRAAAFDQTARHRLRDVDVVITGWGAPTIDADVLAHAPNLHMILHTAGTVKRIVDPVCFDRGITVTTAAAANAIPVAEFTLAAILFAGKQALQSAHLFRHDRAHKPRPDGVRSNYERTIGIIGYSRIGSRVVNLLRPFDLDVLVADPYANPDVVAADGARLVTLDELLTASDIISIHAPALPATRHMLDKHRLALIHDGATIINTARGMIIETAALEAECANGRLNAILDVTDPEPLPADSPLWDAPNVLLTPHIAGAQTTEIHRLIDTALDDLERYLNGEDPHHVITAADLSRIA